MSQDIMFVVSVDYKEFNFVIAEEAIDFAISAYKHQPDNSYSISIKLAPVAITLLEI